MKVNDLVMFRVGLDRHTAIGMVTEINLRTGQCVLYRNGARHVRSLNRVHALDSKRAKQAYRKR